MRELSFSCTGHYFPIFLGAIVAHLVGKSSTNPRVGCSNPSAGVYILNRGLRKWMLNAKAQ